MGYTQNETIGHKYNSNLTTKEIAKLIRQDIKELKLTKKNGYKISVTSDSFAGGSAIDITVKETPFAKYTPEYLEYWSLKSDIERCDWIRSKGIGLEGYCRRDQTTWEYHLFSASDATYGRFTPEMEKLRTVLRYLLDMYRRDDSDSQIDYFDCNFYANIRIEENGISY